MKRILSDADWNVAPYAQYLLVTLDHETVAYELGDDDTLDLETQLKALYPDCVVELTRNTGSDDWAAIITDSRPPNSAVVWQSADIYIEPNY